MFTKSLLNCRFLMFLPNPKWILILFNPQETSEVSTIITLFYRWEYWTSRGGLLNRKKVMESGFEHWPSDSRVWILNDNTGLPESFLKYKGRTFSVPSLSTSDEALTSSKMHWILDALYTSPSITIICLFKFFNPDALPSVFPATVFWQ